MNELKIGPHATAVIFSLFCSVYFVTDLLSMLPFLRYSRVRVHSSRVLSLGVCMHAWMDEPGYHHPFPYLPGCVRFRRTWRCRNPKRRKVTPSRGRLHLTTFAQVEWVMSHYISSCLAAFLSPASCCLRLCMRACECSWFYEQPLLFVNCIFNSDHLDAHVQT